MFVNFNADDISSEMALFVQISFKIYKYDVRRYSFDKRAVGLPTRGTALYGLQSNFEVMSSKLMESVCQESCHILCTPPPPHFFFLKKIVSIF
jgi:hypothetical protein